MANRGCDDNQFTDTPVRRDAERGNNSTDSPLLAESPPHQHPRRCSPTYVSTDATVAKTKSKTKELLPERNNDQESDAIRSTLATETSSPEPGSPEELQEGQCLWESSGGCSCSQDCRHIYSEMCSVCKMPRLHPTDIGQRERHEKECLSVHVRQSLDKECGICLENIFEKEGLEPDKKFGILESCDHSFCICCIEQWRDIQTHGFCPMCRSYSNIMMPSQYWIVCPEEKKVRINVYRDDMEQMALRHFFSILMM